MPRNFERTIETFHALEKLRDRVPNLGVGISIAASLDRVLWVAFTGGEPFLRKDLPEFAGILHVFIWVTECGTS
ncbi:hypothetical protein [Mycobacterium tuberculosis]|uniref:hypothetical protein n=1 Tax=Mycobacterium tuberculosis TaxID=1773 RepID=UPI002729BF77|nr:hypothetical protein [Mycobacterium tuberculosis]